MRKILSIKATAEAAHDFSMLLQNAVKIPSGSGDAARSSALRLHGCRVSSSNGALQDFVITSQVGRLKYIRLPEEC
ncbi:hypothetical protein [Comamonas humi]